MSTLLRQLSARHISMIALGGSIGTGIFLTSGSALYVAGPAGAILAYVVMGIMVFLLMSSLGEMSAYRPISGSFFQYSSDYVSKPFGFAMGYNYWFNWAITIAVELIAAALIMSFWFPTVPTIDWCLLFFIAILASNILSVKQYGETQYWLSLLKIIAIIAFIIIGVVIIAGYNPHHHPIAIHNTSLFTFHDGFSSLFSVFLLSGFAFQGTELIGVAAGEVKNPSKNIPRAVKKIFWRILLFYILIMLIISMIVPYTDPRLLNPDNTVAESPFTIVFSILGLPYISGIMNFVILIALLSACNADMYSSTRILWHLAEKGSAPRFLKYINKRGVPVFALLATSAFGLLAFLCELYGNNVVFLTLVNISSLSGFIAWLAIGVSHLGFRRHYLKQGNDLAALPYQSRFYPWGPYIAIVLSTIIIGGQWYVLYASHQLTIGSLISMYIGLPFVLSLWIGNAILNKFRKSHINASEMRKA